MIRSQGRIALGLGAMLLAIGLVPGQAAPLTAEDVARPVTAWETLARDRVHNFDLPGQGIKIQMTLFDTELLRALMPAIATDKTVPTDPAKVATLLNALKPHAKSMLLYVAVRDREAEPIEWSPVFGINHQSFVIRLAADKNLTPFASEVVSPIGFRVLAEKKPMKPTEAWRALYIMEFSNEEELANFREMPGVLLEYRHPQKPLFLNITNLRDEVELDAAHPDSSNSRPKAQLQLFFDHFPPKEAQPD